MGDRGGTKEQLINNSSLCTKMALVTKETSSIGCSRICCLGKRILWRAHLDCVLSNTQNNPPPRNLLGTSQPVGKAKNV